MGYSAPSQSITVTSSLSMTYGPLRRNLIVTNSDHLSSVRLWPVFKTDSGFDRFPRCCTRR